MANDDLELLTNAAAEISEKITITHTPEYAFAPYQATVNLGINGRYVNTSTFTGTFKEILSLLAGMRIARSMA